MTGLPPSVGSLSSWKAIASHFGVSVKTAQLWEQDRGMPVHRLPGGRGQVWAVVDELEAWRAGAPGPSPPPVGQQPLVRRLAPWALLVVVVVTGLVWLPFGRRAVPYSTAVTRTGLVVFDDHGRELWRYSTRTQNAVDPFEPPERRGLSWVTDLDGDGQPEVLFVPQVDNFAERRLLCFDARGQKRWEYAPNRKVTTKDGQVFAPPYGVTSVLVMPPNHAGRREVVVLSVHHLYFPAQVAVLDDHGRLLREYWHAGHLHYTTTHLVNGRLVLLVGGMNNATRQAEMVALDPASLTGASKEEKDAYQFTGMPPANELGRWQFPRSCINQTFEAMNEVVQFTKNEDGITVSVRERNTPPMAPDILYSFDKNLNFQSSTVSSQFQSEHETLRHNHALDHDLTTKEQANFRPRTPYGTPGQERKNHN